MKEAILKSIRSRSFTTFQDLETDVDGFRGEFAMFSPERESIVIWHAVSREGVQTLGGLIGSQEVFMHIAPKISYRNTGDFPPVPVCRSIPDFAAPTKVIRWFPVVFTESWDFDHTTAVPDDVRRRL